MFHRQADPLIPRFLRANYRGIFATLLCFAVVGASYAAEPVRVLPEGSPLQPRQPQLAIDGRGVIHLTFGSGDSIYVCQSRDRGRTFSPPVKVGDLPGLSLGARRGPRIAVLPSAVVVAAISHDAGNLVAWRSGDGVAWRGPIRVNDVAESAKEGLHAMAAGPRGEIYCVWLDLRGAGTQLFGAGSTDGGKTWSQNRLIYRSPDGSICECCHPAAAYDSQGRLHVMWRNSLGGFRDPFAANSLDDGSRFTVAAKLGVGSWKLDACPMDGGYLAAADAGHVVAVWRRDHDIIRSAVGGAGEQRLAHGEQPWVAGTSAGAAVVWLSRRDGELWLSTPHSAHPRKLADHARDPVIAAPLSKDGPIVVAWETGQRRHGTMMAQVVAD